jgi:hypothetical protein
VQVLNCDFFRLQLLASSESRSQIRFDAVIGTLAIVVLDSSPRPAVILPPATILRIAVPKLHTNWPPIKNAIMLGKQAI